VLDTISCIRKLIFREPLSASVCHLAATSVCVVSSKVPRLHLKANEDL